MRTRWRRRSLRVASDQRSSGATRAASSTRSAAISSLLRSSGVQPEVGRDQLVGERRAARRRRPRAARPRTGAARRRQISSSSTSPSSIDATTRVPGISISRSRRCWPMTNRSISRRLTDDRRSAASAPRSRATSAGRAPRSPAPRARGAGAVASVDLDVRLERQRHVLARPCAVGHRSLLPRSARSAVSKYRSVISSVRQPPAACSAGSARRATRRRASPSANENLSSTFLGAAAPDSAASPGELSARRP